jgi:hypothetical protein
MDGHVLKSPCRRNYCRIFRAISAKNAVDNMRNIATVSKIASFIDCSSMCAPRSFAVRHNGRAEKEHHTEAESMSKMPRIRSSASILKRSYPPALTAGRREKVTGTQGESVSKLQY